MSLGIKYRNVETKRESSKIYEVIEGKVTINREYVGGKFYVDSHNTLFREIEIVPYKDAIPKEWLFEVKRRCKPLSSAEFVDSLIKTLREHIKETWRKKKYHAVLHSSGWDSRVVSTIIRQLYEELGDSWLGEIRFVCYGSECKILKRILEAEGWKDAVPLILPFDDSYLKRSLDFQRAWKYVNGCAPYPVNTFYMNVNELANRHLIPEDPSKTQVWAASYFNELMKFAIEQKKGATSSFLRKYYYCTYAQFVSALSRNIIQPLLNPDTLRFVLEARTPLRDGIRSMIVRKLNTKLASIKPCSSGKVMVSPSHFNSVLADYRGSWYGINVSPPHKATNKMTYSDWWTAWSAASFVEHLIKKGVRVVGGS